MLCSARSSATAWVFYEGPDYHKDHPEYFRWFKRANDHIARRDYSLWRQPAETPNPFDAAVEGELGRCRREARSVQCDGSVPPGCAGARLHPPHRGDLPGAPESGRAPRGELVAAPTRPLRHPSVMAIVSPLRGSCSLRGCARKLAAGFHRPRRPGERLRDRGEQRACEGQLKLQNRYVSLTGSKLVACA